MILSCSSNHFSFLFAFLFLLSVFRSQIGVFCHLIKWEYKCSTKTRRHKETGELVETRQWRLQNKRLGVQNKKAVPHLLNYEADIK
jgi:hypothetical protein